METANETEKEEDKETRTRANEGHACVKLGARRVICDCVALRSD